METKKVKCSSCRNFCEIEVQVEDGEVIEVVGNGCMRGYAKAQEEINLSLKDKGKS